MKCLLLFLLLFALVSCTTKPSHDAFNEPFAKEMVRDYLRQQEFERLDQGSLDARRATAKEKRLK